LSWSLVNLLFITEFFLYHKLIYILFMCWTFEVMQLFENRFNLDDETTTQSNHSSTTIHFAATIIDEGNSQI